jgi:uncharacterized protein
VARAGRRAKARIADLGQGRRLRLRTEDGFELYSRVHRAPGSRACLVLSHGITSDCSEGGAFTQLARRASDRGISVIRFDFRGHGRSQGQDRDFLLSTQRRDLATVLAAAAELALGPLLLLGMSFGAAPVVAQSAGSDSCTGLILWSPMVDYAGSLLAPNTPWAQRLLSRRGDASLPDWVFAPAPGDGFRFSKALADECRHDTTASTLRSLHSPVLVFSSDADEKVPFAAMADVAAGNPSIDFRPLAGDVHTLTASRARVIGETLDWTEERL